jgi:hypothetical protein
MIAHAPVDLSTIAQLVTHRHKLACFCAACNRWADLDLPLLVMRGHGWRRIATLRSRCRYCGEPGKLQLRAPSAPWPLRRAGSQ